MLKKILTVSAVVGMLAGCSTTTQNSESDPQTPTLTQYNRHKINGSSHFGDEGVSNHQAYFLYGAEHLKLDNYYFDIPVVYNEAVKKWVDYFLNRGRGFFERYSARAGRYAPIMGQILEENGLPRDLIFLAMAESGFQNKAKSWALAVGPWQFMPYTGKRYGLKIDWYVDERRDPYKATVAASLYLKKLYDDFGSWELAAAGYNAGEGKIGRAIKRYNTENFWELREGRYLKSETKNYVPKIMALAIIGKNLRAFGFEDIGFYDPLDFEEIEVKPMTDLVKLAEKIEVDFEEIQYLNPEILRWFTPPNMDSYTLRIPTGKKIVWNQVPQNEMDELIATDFKTYKISQNGTTLADISRRHRINGSYVLTDLNNVSYNRQLRKGDVILLPFRAEHTAKEDMYADLYERPRKTLVRGNQYKRRIAMASKTGKRISNPKSYYTVQKGDSLWSVSKKTGVSVDTLIMSNIQILKNRMIRAGDRLIVR